MFDSSRFFEPADRMHFRRTARKTRPAFQRNVETLLARQPYRNRHGLGRTDIEWVWFVYIFLALLAVVLLLWLLLAAPIGIRRVQARARIAADPDRIWQALYPFGDHVNWNQAIANVRPLATEGDLVGRIVTTHTGRDGAPIERDFIIDALVPQRSFQLRYRADTALDDSFWRDHAIDVAIMPGDDGHCAVTIAETDCYRGAAFAVFRFFALRRQAAKLKIWAETGQFTQGGLFERPITQFALACLSTLLLWPLFGLTPVGLFLAATLTAVVALHELGHVAAFRLAGHNSARMIFIPILGGIALGGRPYDTRFEVGFAALMGAGFSAFLAALLVIGHMAAAPAMAPFWANALLIAIVICTAFNLGNLAPIWRFDGGQVIRQVFETRWGQVAASAAIITCFAATGLALTLPVTLIVAAGLVLLVIGLITSGIGVRPRKPLKPMNGRERLAIACGFAAVFSVHALALIWSVELLVA